jgi:hypothetical protein
MDTFLQAIVVCALLVNLAVTAFFIFKVLYIQGVLERFRRDFGVEMNCWEENFGNQEDKIDSIAYETTKSLVKLEELLEKIELADPLAAKKEPTEQTMPNRRNNWDSVRTAFSGPTKVEVNVRN